MTASTRRVWSREDKQAIIFETMAPEVTVSMVARRHNMHASLLFRWRRDAFEEARLRTHGDAARFRSARVAGTGQCAIGRAVWGRHQDRTGGGTPPRADASVEIAVLRGVIKGLVGR